jgi:hypothetical protein
MDAESRRVPRGLPHGISHSRRPGSRRLPPSLRESVECFPVTAAGPGRPTGRLQNTAPHPHGPGRAA